MKKISHKKSQATMIAFAAVALISGGCGSTTANLRHSQVANFQADQYKTYHLVEGESAKGEVVDTVRRVLSAKGYTNVDKEKASAYVEVALVDNKDASAKTAPASKGNEAPFAAGYVDLEQPVRAVGDDSAKEVTSATKSAAPFAAGYVDLEEPHRDANLGSAAGSAATQEDEAPFGSGYIDLEPSPKRDAKAVMIRLKDAKTNRVLWSGWARVNGGETNAPVATSALLSKIPSAS